MSQADPLHEDTVLPVVDDGEPAAKAKATQLKDEGNDCFKNKDYERAFELYSAALSLCPASCSTDRCVLLSNRAAARSYLDPEDREAILEDCSESLDLDASYLKPRLRRAQTYRQMGAEKLDAALEDFRKILEADPDSSSVRRVVYELEAEISERNSKLQQEMLGKLKDLGNLVLKPFGLSTNNFQMDQNESGGYSINFKPASGASQT